MKRTFERADMGGSGGVTPGELQNVFQQLGHSADPARVQQLVSKYDHSGTGQLEFPEWMALLQNGPLKLKGDPRAQAMPQGMPQAMPQAAPQRSADDLWGQLLNHQQQQPATAMPSFGGSYGGTSYMSTAPAYGGSYGFGGGYQATYPSTSYGGYGGGYYF